MPDHQSIADEIPRVVMGDVPITEFQDLVINHSGSIGSLFRTPYIEWHRHPGSDLGDIIAVEMASLYHEYVKELVVTYIAEVERQAHVPEHRRLKPIGQVICGSLSRMGASNGGFTPFLSEDELSALANDAASLPRQTLVMEVGVGISSWAKIRFTPEQVPDLYLKVYLFTRDDDFEQPIQVLDVGDCDEHGQVRDRHQDQGEVNLMIPIGALYYGAAMHIPGNWLEVHFGTLAEDLREAVSESSGAVVLGISEEEFTIMA
ncbi:hypothetical protein R1sor_021251 [Riccia sorocarpa]|uniref:Uncharacterized protein n=1 Tax=Riccia sorocarpa TaxID=122646 RepID=A0ABD3GJW2_9MARC